MLFSSGGRYLNFSNDFRDYFSEENPQLFAFDGMEKSYSKADNLLFILEPEEGEIFTTSTLGVIETLTQQAWELPFVSRVDSITNY